MKEIFVGISHLLMFEYFYYIRNNRKIILFDSYKILNIFVSLDKMFFDLYCMHKYRFTRMYWKQMLNIWSRLFPYFQNSFIILSSFDFYRYDVMKTLLCARFMWGTLISDEWANNFDYFYIFFIDVKISFRSFTGNSWQTDKIYWKIIF